MTKKIKYFILVFACLFFVNFVSVKASDDYYTINFSTMVDDYSSATWLDDETNTTYHSFELFDWVIDEYASDNNFMLFIKTDLSDMPQNVYFNGIAYMYIVRFDNSYSYSSYFAPFSFNSHNFMHLNFGSNNSCFGFSTSAGILNGHSFSYLKTQLDNFFSQPFSSCTDGAMNFENYNLYQWYPFFSNVSNVIYDPSNSNNLDIKIIRPGGKISTVRKGDNLSSIFYLPVDSIVENAPKPSFSIGSATENTVDDVSVISSIDVDLNWDFINKNRYVYFYSLDDGENWLEYSGTSDILHLTISENTVIRAKIFNKITSSFLNEKSLSITFIGKSSLLFNSYKEQLYYDDLSSQDVSLSDVSSPLDLVSFWKNIFNSKFPIFAQISNIIAGFDYDFNSDNCFQSGYSESLPPGANAEANRVCAPDLKINLSFLGIDKDYSIFDWSTWYKYRDRVFMIIKIIAGFYTFKNIIDIIREGVKK